MSSFDSLKDFVKRRLTDDDEDIFESFQKVVVKYEEEINRLRGLLDLCLKPDSKQHMTDCLQRHGCDEEEEDEEEVHADQQLWNQEVKSSMEQEDTEILHRREETEEPHINQEGEQLVHKQETDVVMFTPASEEDQTPCVKAEDFAAQTESVVNLLVISSVVGAANVDLLISNSSHVPIGHDERGETGGKEDETEPQFQTTGTRNTKKESYVCTVCNKGFTQSGLLQTHRRIHTGDNSYSCTTCGKHFTCKQSLTNHMKIHTEEKSYTCEHCGKSFRHRSFLRKHKKIHLREKPHGCETCGKRFTWKQSLTQHMRIHTGEKGYHCEQCEKSFRHGNSLIKHMRTHTGEKPHGCKTCGKCFTWKQSLTQHMRIHTR